MVNKILEISRITNTKTEFVKHAQTIINVCMKKMCYREASYSTNLSRVRICQDPILEAISDRYADIIRKSINDIEKSDEINKRIDDTDEYLEITYADGTVRDFYLNQKIDKLFDEIEFDENAPFYSIGNPILKFENKNIRKEVELLEEWVVRVKDKKFEPIINCFDAECTLSLDGNQIYNNKAEIIAGFNKFRGFMNLNLKKMSFYSTIEGMLDSTNKSIVCLKIEVRNKKTELFFVQFIFDSNLKVKQIDAISGSKLYFGDTKWLSPKALELVKNGKYDDLDEETQEYINNK